VAEPFRSVAALCAVLDDQRGGDVVTALAHHLQCAALLAAERPEDVELQVAGLVHDVASSIEPRPQGDHALVGAELVRPLLGDRVADLVAGHVRAKRYLVTVDPEYRSLLSAASTTSLHTQGNGLSPAELAEFESSPLADEWRVLRIADDRAKVPGADVAPLDAWQPVLESLARR